MAVRKMIRGILALVLAGAWGNAWAFGPLFTPSKQDSGREPGYYQVELARAKQNYIDRLQRSLEETGSVATKSKEELGESPLIPESEVE